MRVENPSHRAVMRADVVRTERITEHFVNVTLGGDELADFEFLGRDQFVRLFLPRPGQERVHLPTVADRRWVSQLYAMPKERQPYVRNYSVRRFDPSALEMDIEFVDHGEGGPASAWARNARPGDGIGLLTDGVYYLPSPGSGTQLLVGDESALPAIVSILEQAPEGLRARVYLEVPSAADVRPLRSLPGVEVHWLPRTDPHEVPGRLALEAVRAADLPGERPYCFIAGENALPTELRRHLVRERGVAKDDITFIGYWKHGQAVTD
ncbi:siderophore-interacting protein [Nocardiopsis lambiniae]|uniref:Siderophore-interacting protein n=1 Tax=Nocardiopsis lambiniae TaxID=3075539 RepID=A0ABU2M7A7_9ACTN|nr:siderophore-interacting protein [Nocardiopsis sp. DSM 44743]MDT0328468.1 siderophore-interacting protein [Nocardiopsis sp. DSM 44743]